MEFVKVHNGIEYRIAGKHLILTPISGQGVALTADDFEWLLDFLTDFSGVASLEDAPEFIQESVKHAMDEDDKPFLPTWEEELRGEQ